MHSNVSQKVHREWERQNYRNAPLIKNKIKKKAKFARNGKLINLHKPTMVIQKHEFKNMSYSCPDEFFFLWRDQHQVYWFEWHSNNAAN